MKVRLILFELMRSINFVSHADTQTQTDIFQKLLNSVQSVQKVKIYQKPEVEICYNSNTVPLRM